MIIVKEGNDAYQLGLYRTLATSQRLWVYAGRSPVNGLIELRSGADGHHGRAVGQAAPLSIGKFIVPAVTYASTPAFVTAVCPCPLGGYPDHRRLAPAAYLCLGHQRG